MSRIIIDDIEDGTDEMTRDLKNYLKSHDWDFEEQDFSGEGDPCIFCKRAPAVFSLEREDEHEEDLERELFLLCEDCQDTFVNVCDVLRLKEEKK